MTPEMAAAVEQMPDQFKQKIKSGLAQGNTVRLSNQPGEKRHFTTSAGQDCWACVFGHRRLGLLPEHFDAVREMHAVFDNKRE